MKDFYNNNKKLCLIIVALLLFALCRMAIYDRRYYVSQNRYVVINRLTGSCVWCNAKYKDSFTEKVCDWFNGLFNKQNNCGHNYADEEGVLYTYPASETEKYNN